MTFNPELLPEKLFTKAIDEAECGSALSGVPFFRLHSGFGQQKTFHVDWSPDCLLGQLDRKAVFQIEVSKDCSGIEIVDGAGHYNRKSLANDELVRLVAELITFASFLKQKEHECSTPSS